MLVFDEGVYIFITSDVFGTIFIWNLVQQSGQSTSAIIVYFTGSGLQGSVLSLDFTNTGTKPTNCIGPLKACLFIHSVIF